MTTLSRPTRAIRLDRSDSISELISRAEILWIGPRQHLLAGPRLTRPAPRTSPRQINYPE
jgi:hypothetical protein